MKKRTTLFILAALLSASFGIQAQNLSRQLLSPVTLQQAPLLPQAASENTDKTGWLWKTRVKKIYQKGECLTAEKVERTFDEHDRLATMTITDFIYDTYTCELVGIHRRVRQYNSNGFCNREEYFLSRDGVNFTLSCTADMEADPIFTQTVISNHALSLNTETNQWEVDRNLTWWKDVKRDDEGRITEVVSHAGAKPNSTSSLVQYQYSYKDGERAPYEIVLFPTAENVQLKNIKWHESDGNFIWQSNKLFALFFEDPDGNASKTNKPISYEVYDKDGNWLGAKQYSYQADGSYEYKTETTNWTQSVSCTMLDQYGSYKGTINTVENQRYSKVFERKLFNERGDQTLYERCERLNKVESTGDWEFITEWKYENTYENGVLTAIKIEPFSTYIHEDGSMEQRSGEPTLYDFSDFHQPQTGIDNQTAANDLNVVFINNCLQLDLPVGTSYMLCDIQGRVITSGNEAPEQLDLSNYTNGVYLFKVMTKDGRQQCFKLMKH